MHTTTHCTRTDRSIDGARIDWAREVRLALVLSVAAVLATITLAGRVPDRVLVTSVIVAASAIAWSRIEPVQEPDRVPVRRR